jgi:hypothetical protein
MLSDDECLAQLGPMALGRNQKQLAYLTHVAHEGVARAAEQAKHVALKAGRSDWPTLKGYLLDGQGSHIIDISLGLAVGALLDDKPDEFEFQLRALFKSALLGLPHVLQQAMSQRMPPRGSLGAGGHERGRESVDEPLP